MTYLESVVRILRSLAVIRGDTDAPTSFSQTQLNAELQIAQIAIQNELISLIARRLIPKERKTTGAIAQVAGTVEYDLATDFVRLYGNEHIHDVTNNSDLFPYPGGLERLQLADLNYATNPGTPQWFYFSPQNSTQKKVGLYPKPQADATLQYDYECSVLITTASQDLPFHNDEECYTFTEMAGRRFKFMWEDTKGEADIALVLEKDYSYKSARATLYNLLRIGNPSNSYGVKYA